MAQVSIKFANGKRIVAPAELWIWAIFESLDEKTAEKVTDKIMKFRENSLRTQALLDELAPGGKPGIQVELN